MDNNEVVVAEEVAAVAENNTGIEIEPLFEEQVDFDVVIRTIITSVTIIPHITKYYYIIKIKI